MRSVAIIGAGAIGAAAARALAGRETAGRIVMVDAAASVAAGKALDIAQSGPIDGWDTRVTGHADLDPAMSPGLVIVADRHGADGEWQGEPALEMLRRSVMPLSCPVVFAGAGQASVMATAARELGIDPRRLLGSAPEALASAARALTALAARASAADVAVSIVGVPGRFVCAWNQSRVGGRGAPDVFRPAELAALEARIQASWPPGPYALGSAAAAVADALIRELPRRPTVFAVLEGSTRSRPMVAALPATLGHAGVVSTHVPELSPRERLVFDHVLAEPSPPRR